MMQPKQLGVTKLWRRARTAQPATHSVAPSGSTQSPIANVSHTVGGVTAVTNTLAAIATLAAGGIFQPVISIIERIHASLQV